MSDVNSPQFPGDLDETMDRCTALGAKLWQAEGVLSHERVARDLVHFLWARMHEQPATPQRDALLSLVNIDYRTATYLSCGQKLVVASLARLIRQALAYADRDGYDESWRP